ncbi:hypothetical protein JCM17843_28950 [Kordiimonadales bacterium JCM 17843]|nr:hypothetical protein JCM17843_28950 [Kordiimonadales bacterium JCM 17843]
MTLLRDLADLMFAHALLPETLALIDEQNEAQRQSGLSDVEATRATRMASVVLSGSGAEDGLLLALVKERDLDACLWSAVRFALAGGPVPGHRWFAAVLPRLKDYPHWVEARVTAITAEALLETGRRSEVQGLVGNFDASLPSDFPADQTAISVIRARLAEETGDFNRALQLYGQAENGEGAAAIDARLRRLTLEWRTGHQSLASVILGLEHLRYDWHGDATAWQVMLTLASAYREYGAPIESGFVLLSLLEQTTDDLWQRVAREALNELVHGLLVVSQQQADIDEAELLSIIDFSEASRPFWDPGLIGRDLVRNYGRFLRNAGLAGHAARMLEEYRETVSPAEARSLSADQAEMWIAARQPEQALDVLTTSKLPWIDAILGYCARKRCNSLDAKQRHVLNWQHWALLVSMCRRVCSGCWETGRLMWMKGVRLTPLGMRSGIADVSPAFCTARKPEKPPGITGHRHKTVPLSRPSTATGNHRRRIRGGLLRHRVSPTARPCTGLLMMPCRVS